MNIELTPQERKEFIDQARREFLLHMIDKHATAFDLVSRAQAGGLLDVAPNTLASIPGLTAVNVIPRKVVKYKLSEIKRVLAEREVIQ